MIFSADFETTTQPDDCRVWAWALCEVGNCNNIKIGTDISSMFSCITELKQNLVLYFHNLKFDGEFILNWLFKNNFVHVLDRKKLTDKTFCTLISDKGVFYSIEILIENIRIKIYDSLKLFPFSVDKIAKAFNLSTQKLSIDYTAIRPVGWNLTDEEIEYIKHDVVIVANALEILFAQKLNKMTIGSNALEDYKQIIQKNRFKKMFPPPNYDSDIRKAYRGGFTYLNPKFKEIDIGVGIVLDVNSLYPSVMYYNDMPYGDGIAYEGTYIPDEMYPLYVQYISCQFEIKKDKIPTIQLKNNLAFVPNEYITSSNGEYVTMALTSVDLELFLKHYDVYDLDYLFGYKFKASNTLFRDYIDKWNKIKVESTINGNAPMRQIAKLMLNNLYGKFALNPNVRSKIPYLGDDGIIHYKLGEEEKREPIYIPVGVFITAWARYKTITSAQSVYDRFVYADTDSLHLIGDEIPKELEVSDVELGKWKVESRFTRARFLRQKTYIEEINDELKITCAGMPESCYQYVNWDNFRTGAEYPGKLKISHVAGGIVLADSPHTLR